MTEMNGKMMDGKPLYVALAQPAEVRKAQLASRFAGGAGGRGVAQPMQFPVRVRPPCRCFR